MTEKLGRDEQNLAMDSTLLQSSFFLNAPFRQCRASFWPAWAWHSVIVPFAAPWTSVRFRGAERRKIHSSGFIRAARAWNLTIAKIACGGVRGAGHS